MARLLIAMIAVILLFGGVLAADQALQNPDVEPADSDDAADQELFTETTAPLIQTGGLVALFALVVGIALGAVRAVGGG